MRKSLDWLYKSSLYAGAFFIFAICAVVVAQVSLNLADRIARLIFGNAIGLTIPSYSDFTGFFLAAASFLALAGTLREGGHIRVTLVIGLLPRKAHKAFDIAAVALALIIAAYATWYSMFLVYESWFYNDLSPGMVPVPLWLPQSAIAIGLLILTIALIDELVCQLRGENASWDGKGENLLGDKKVE
ncbi:MAG: TRAP transporter small permease [Rhizobiaceae bacterium]|nr:TRAP transporter small permease [Rhizobiaceae bacterium]